MTHPSDPLSDTSRRDPALKFGVCAFIDLQGFSSHLELSGYDLRTAIGKHAVDRLQHLENGIALVLNERTRRPAFYPDIHLRRINDAIVVALDLDDILIPSIGEVRFHGVPPSAFGEFFSDDEMREESNFSSVYDARVLRATEPLEQFLGIVARLHLFIQTREARGYFPGAKTIVASGFRRQFISSTSGEDVLSANFALANASMADKALHGPNLFVDNNLLEVVSRNRFAQHLTQFASYDWRAAAFDPLTSQGGDNVPPPRPVVHASVEVSLFRRSYMFRRLSASPLTYLQHLQSINPFLVGARTANRTNVFYAHVLDAIRFGIGTRRIRESAPPLTFLNNGANDLSVDVAEFEEFLANGTSATNEARRKRQSRAALGIPDLPPESPVAKALDEFDEQETTVDIPATLDVKDLGHSVWSLSEETLSSFAPIMSGDWSLLAYPRED